MKRAGAFQEAQMFAKGAERGGTKSERKQRKTRTLDYTTRLCAHTYARDRATEGSTKKRKGNDVKYEAINFAAIFAAIDRECRRTCRRSDRRLCVSSSALFSPGILHRFMPIIPREISLPSPVVLLGDASQVSILLPSGVRPHNTCDAFIMQRFTFLSSP